MQRVQPARGRLFEAGTFGARNGRFYLLHLAVQTGRRRQLGEDKERALATSPAPRHVGETEPGKSPGTRSISKKPSPGDPSPRTARMGRESRRRTNVGPGATVGLLSGRDPSPVASHPRCRTTQRPGVSPAKRAPRLVPLVVCQERHRQPIPPMASRGGRNSRRCAHNPRSLSMGAEARLDRFIWDERTVGRIIRVNNYAAHTIVCPSTGVCRLLSTSETSAPSKLRALVVVLCSSCCMCVVHVYICVCA